MADLHERAARKIRQEQAAFIAKYEDYPKWIPDCCMCVFIYKQATATERLSLADDDSVVIDAYTCHLHKNAGNPKQCHQACLDETRSIRFMFGHVPADDLTATKQKKIDDTIAQRIEQCLTAKEKELRFE